MNLHHLRVFHVTAKAGSITAASRELHVSQPALSRELKTFEDRLGVVLFERLPRGMRLTQAGISLAEYAQRLFEIARVAESSMKEIARGEAGHLHLAASNTVGTYVLPRYLARFREKHPGVAVSLFVGNTSQVAQGVADMRYSLGFIEGPLHVEGLVASPLMDDEVLPVVAAGHPLARRRKLAPRDLDGQPLLMREEGSGTRELVAELLQAQAVEAGSIMEFGNTEAIKQACLHGGGVAWLPAVSMQSELAQKSLVTLPCKALSLRRPFSLLRRPGSTDSPADQAFLSLLD